MPASHSKHLFFTIPTQHMGAVGPDRGVTVPSWYGPPFGLGQPLQRAPTHAQTATQVSELAAKRSDMNSIRLWSPPNCPFHVVEHALFCSSFRLCRPSRRRRWKRGCNRYIIPSHDPEVHRRRIPVRNDPFTLATNSSHLPYIVSQCSHARLQTAEPNGQASCSTVSVRP